MKNLKPRRQGKGKTRIALEGGSPVRPHEEFLVFGAPQICEEEITDLASRFFEPVYRVYDHPWFSTYPSFAYGVAYIALSLAVFLLKGSLFWLIVSYCLANIIYFTVAFTASCKLLT